MVVVVLERREGTALGRSLRGLEAELGEEVVGDAVGVAGVLADGVADAVPLFGADGCGQFSGDGLQYEVLNLAAYLALGALFQLSALDQGGVVLLDGVD